MFFFNICNLKNICDIILKGGKEIMKKGFILGIVITIVSAIVAGWFAITAEGDVPINWNIHGEVNRYGSAWWMFIFPAISLFVTVLGCLIPKIDPKGDNIEKSGPILPVIMVMVSALMLGIQIFVIMAANGSDIMNLHVFISLILGIMFIVMGYYTPRIKQNYMLGIRTPWTLANEKVWTRTHEVSKYWIMGGGLLFLASMFFNNVYSIIVPTVFIVVVALGLVVYSYVLYLKEKKA